jgi:hypothetical protein
MMRRLSFFIFVIPLLAGQVLVAPAAYAGRKFDWEILFIGNSLVRGIKRPLASIFAAQGQSARIKAAAPAIEDLAYHARSGRTQKIIEGKDWDFIFLQEKSIGLAEAGGGYSAVRTLYNIIAPTGAQAGMFMTWRERNISPMSPLWNLLKGEPDEHTGYVPIAHELGIGVAPVGWAVRQARIEMGDSPPWDLWKGGKGRHLSPAAQYLASCVIYSVVTGESPRGLWAPETLPVQTADFLQSVAEQILMGDEETWNLAQNAD